MIVVFSVVQVSIKYRNHALLNIVIVQNFTSPSSSKDTFLGIPTLLSPSECEMLMKSCLPMHHTCVVDNDISPNDISDDNIRKNIIMLQYYSALYICVYIKNRITYSISIMYTYKCSLLLATCS